MKPIVAEHVIRIVQSADNRKLIDERLLGVNLRRRRGMRGLI